MEQVVDLVDPSIGMVIVCHSRPDVDFLRMRLRALPFVLVASNVWVNEGRLAILVKAAAILSQK